MSRSTPRRGFTLVELLVVIAIIGVLAAMVTAAAVNAITAANETRIKVEAANLAAAFKAYKAKYGSYPPNFDPSNGNDAVVNHLRKAFPRIAQSELTAVAGYDYGPAEAVVFWLQGFKPDVTQPINGAGQRTPFFEFDERRVGTTYHPEGLTQPYVYFDGTRTYNATAQTVTVADKGTITPYPGVTEDIQVVSAGLDDHWGTVDSSTNLKKPFPTGPYIGADADNLASFSDKNMEDSQL